MTDDIATTSGTRDWPWPSANLQAKENESNHLRKLEFSKLLPEQISK
jgi:hypothetical protein